MWPSCGGASMDKQHTSQDYRQWWADAECVLKELRETNPAAVATLTHLARIAGELAVGIIPPGITKVSSAGRKGASWAEKTDIGWAVDYLRACAEGRITDEHPTWTVAEAYGVGIRTVQGWRNRMPANFPSEPLAGDAVQRQMRAAGRYYKRFGRSWHANRKRPRSEAN